MGGCDGVRDLLGGHDVPSLGDASAAADKWLRPWPGAPAACPGTRARMAASEIRSDTRDAAALARQHLPDRAGGYPGVNLDHLLYVDNLDVN